MFRVKTASIYNILKIDALFSILACKIRHGLLRFQVLVNSIVFQPRFDIWLNLPVAYYPLA